MSVPDLTGPPSSSILLARRWRPDDGDRQVATRSFRFWGMVMAITTESMLFAGLLSSYVFLRATSQEWPLGGEKPPELTKVTIFTFVLWGSSIPVMIAERALRKERNRLTRAALATTFLMGLSFLVYTIWEIAKDPMPYGENAYASIYYTTIGLHAIHLAIGITGSIGIQAKVWTGRIRAGHEETMKLWGMYWHFVDAVWVFVYGILYLSPRWKL